MPMSAETKDRFEQEERAYWQQRPELLNRNAGQWVAIVGGQVVATGDSSGAVIREAYRKTGSRIGYVARVGHEDELYRIRRVTSGYHDRSYNCPIPRVVASTSHLMGSPSADVDFVVDTGADLTILQEKVANQLGVWDSAWRSVRVAGVGAVPQVRSLYAVSVCLDNHDVPVEVDCRDDIDEDILGRDVINEFTLTVCAKRDEVYLEWANGP
jgi:predicted aspartyl protease